MSGPYEKSTECPALPVGWKRKEILKQSGVSAAKIEVSYISPSGRVFHSRAQLERYLGSSWDLSRFDFESGRCWPSGNQTGGSGGAPSSHGNLHQQRRTIPHGTSVRYNPMAAAASQPSQRHLQQHHHQQSQRLSNVQPRQNVQRGTPVMSTHTSQGLSGGHNRTMMSSAPSSKPQTHTRSNIDTTLVPPLRQTASIFKQPVTLVHTTSRETKEAPPNELKGVAITKPEKPRQVFWARRLDGLSCFAPTVETEAEAEAATLPDKVVPGCNGIEPTVAVASLAKALQIPNPGRPVAGQTGTKRSLELNPGVFVEPDQPLIQGVVITELDVQGQEKRVLDARKRLEQAIKHFG